MFILRKMNVRRSGCLSSAVLWIFLTGLFLTAAAEAEMNFNLFMNRSETMRLLGIAEELYYVRNGVVNDYALSFNLPIKSGMIDIYFSWQATNDQQQQPLNFLSYSLSVFTSNSAAIDPPLVSIPKEGQVPRHVTVFRIRLLCSGSVKAEVDIRVLINVTGHVSTNVTSVEIRRRKMCLKGFPDAVAVDGRFHPMDGQTEAGEEEEKKDEEEEEEIVSQSDVAFSTGNRGSHTVVGSSQVFYVGVGSTCGAILLISCSILVYYLHQRRPVNCSEGLSYSTSTTVVSHDRVQVKGDTSSRSTISASVRRSATPVAAHDLSVLEVRSSLQEIAIDARHVTLTTLVAEGAFGRIYLGTMSSQMNDEDSPPVSVLIKTITEEAPTEEEHLMLRSGALTKGLRHQNLTSILAAALPASSSPSNPPLLIYPVLANEHNLKTFLQSCSLSHPDLTRALSTRQLIGMANQIALAVRYLHRRKITHRDVAARNCAVDGSLTVRLTDGALAPDLFPVDYEVTTTPGDGEGGGGGERERRPTKWMALEALVHRRYSPASDAWSFGVTLWELMTLGQQPYADVDPAHMATCLQAGYRMSQPVDCPNKLFGLMAWCWSLCPSERPRLSQIIAVLEELHSGLGQFV